MSIHIEDITEYVFSGLLAFIKKQEERFKSGWMTDWGGDGSGSLPRGWAVYALAMPFLLKHLASGKLVRFVVAKGSKMESEKRD